MPQPVLNVVHSLHPGEEMPDAHASFDSDDVGATLDRAKREARPKTKFALPPDRLTTKAQLNVLRAYSAASEDGKKQVHYRYVADVAGMHRSTVSSANPFFVEVGFISKADGEFMPAPEVVAYRQAYDWNAQTAPLKLAPVIERSWFFATLRPHLGFGPMQESDAIQRLAEECSAAPSAADSLRMLLDYLEQTGLVEREGGIIKRAKRPPPIPHGGTPAAPSTPKVEAPSPPTDPATVTSNTPASTKGRGGDGLQFSVNIRVDLAEMSHWQADRIAAFFSGMAQVIAAKKGMDEE